MIAKEILKGYENKIVVINAVQGENKRTYFPPWQKKRNDFLYQGNLTNQNLREIRDNELILEFDHLLEYEIGTEDYNSLVNDVKIYINKIKEKFLQENKRFWITEHENGKSPHLRLQINDLEKLPITQRITYKQLFVNKLLSEINFESKSITLDWSLIKSKSKLVSIEGQSHFKSKYNFAKEIISFENFQGQDFELNELLLKETLNKHNTYIQEDKNISLTDFNIKKLELNQLKSIWKQNYTQGKRNTLLLALGGLLHRKGISFEDAKELLKQLLNFVNDGHSFNFRANELKYCFQLNRKEVAVLHWLIIGWGEIEGNKLYVLLKECFQNKEKTIYLKNGYFKIKEHKNDFMVFYYDLDGTHIGSKLFDYYINLNKFNKFIKNNEIKIEEGSVNVYKEIIKVINVIRVSKERLKTNESFFCQRISKESNQLIINKKLFYTMSDEERNILISFDNFEDINDNDDFSIKFGYLSNILSEEGFKKWQNKDINKDIYNDIKEKLKEYIFFPDEEDYDLITLWLFHTYLFNIQGNTVYLHFTGMPDTGKSTAQKVLNKLCWNSQYICNMSEAALFREVDYLQNTLHIDEIDKWNKEHLASFQGLMNNGYSKGGSVKRIEKDEAGNFRPVGFKVFCPKTITTNNPYFLNSFKTRCIDIIGFRSNKHLKNIDCLTIEEEKEFIKLRDDIYVFMLNKGIDIYHIFLADIHNFDKISNRTSQIIAVLSCFSDFFKINFNFEQYLSKNKEDIGEAINYYSMIVECLVKNIQNHSCIITAKEISNYINDKLQEIYGDWNKNYNVIKIGIKMKHMGFKKFKKQILGSERKYHYDIPKKVIESTIKNLNLKIEIENDEGIFK
ncbi:hypothetical protein COY27_06410 [Candidatus Woesearchaeota archaeon CG_4_10_14_0_2_um_filter_33_13]|nr:MAG: hypothetical protein COY27_06410 [Candidatus Woesearchaeota archaeon CG_4_10_14_0_2_um_filter_33_13]